MKFNYIKSQLNTFYKFFIEPPKCWKLPEKSEILIYDNCGAAFFAQYLFGYSVETLYLRREKINVPCLLRAVFSVSFWSGQPIKAYSDAFIKFVSPKVIIAFMESLYFYTISSRFPAVKTVFFQHGIRSEIGGVFGYFDEKNNDHVDYMLVHGDAIGRHYQQFISGKFIPIGSLKNNQVDKSGGCISGSVLFISQFEKKPDNESSLLINHDGTEIQWDQFYEAEKRVLRFLKKWCIANDKILKICLRQSGDDLVNEKEFYTEYLDGCRLEFCQKSTDFSSYKLVDEAEIVVFVDSTLGYESLARGNKTACFSCRGITLHSKSCNFGWPAEFSDNGFFWTNSADEKEFKRVMDSLNTVTDTEWTQIINSHADGLMKYDPGNTKFIALLAELLPKSAHT